MTFIPASSPAIAIVPLCRFLSTKTQDDAIKEMLQASYFRLGGESENELVARP